MSDKDNIREMVMALARGDHEAADAAFKGVSTAKTKSITESILAVEEEVSEEVSDEVNEDANDESNDKKKEDGDLDENYAMRASHRHARAGGRHMRRKRDLNRDMHRRPTDEARRNRDVDHEERRGRGRRRPADASMKRRRPRRSDMYEKSDTGADSATVKGANDHKKHTGDKPNAIKDKGKVAPSSKTHEEE